MFDIDVDRIRRQQRRMNPSDKQGFTYLMFGAVAAAAIALAGCASESETASESPPSAEKAAEPGPDLAASGLLGAEWRAVAYADGPALKGVYNTMTFEADGSVGGRAACNAWRGGAEVTGDQMSFGNAISTMMACPEAAMISERRFLSQLPNVRSYKIENNVLTLNNAAGGLVMRLERSP